MDVQRTLGIPALQLPFEQRVVIPQNDAGVVTLITAVAQRNQQGLPVDLYDNALRDYLSNPLRFLKFVYFHPDAAYQALRLPLPRVHGLLAKISAITKSRFLSSFLPPDIRSIRVVDLQFPSAPAQAYDPVRASGIDADNIEATFLRALRERSPELLDSCIHYVNHHPTAGLTILHCPDESLSLRIAAGIVPAGIAKALEWLGPQISKVSFSQTSASVRPLRRPIDVYSIAQKVHNGWTTLESVGVKGWTIACLLWNIRSIVQTIFFCLSTLQIAASSVLCGAYWAYRGSSVRMTLAPIQESQGIFSPLTHILEKSVLESIQDGYAGVNSGFFSVCSSVYHVVLPNLFDMVMIPGICWAHSHVARLIFRKTILERPRVWEDKVADGVDRVCSQLWPARPRTAHPLIGQLPPTLRELDVSKAGDLQDDHLLAIANRCPGLQKLTIGNRSRLTTNGWRSLARFPQLTQLQISIENGEGFGTLRRLQLASVLGDRPGLRIGLSCEATTFTHSLQFLDHLPPGAELSARIKKADQSSGLSYFLARTQNLVSLRLPGWCCLTDRHCEQIAARHPHIRELRARHIFGGMKTLASSCEQLETLVLKGHKGIEGLDELVSKNPRLRVVRLSNVSASVMDSLRQLPQMQELILADGNEIVDAHIRQLLESKPGLDLTIDRLSNVTPAMYQQVADFTYTKRQAQALRLERGVRRTVERAMQVYDRRHVALLMQMGFMVLLENPPLDLLDPSRLGIARTAGGRPTEISTAQLSLLAQLLPASSYSDLRKRLSVLVEEYNSLLMDPATLMTEDFDLQQSGDNDYFNNCWGVSFQRPILKSLLQETPLLASSYTRYLQEAHPQLDLALLDEWYRELRADIRAVLDLHRVAVQQLGSVSLSLPELPWDTVFQKPEFAEPCKRFFERIRTYADQHAWSDKERWAAAFYALFQNVTWLQEYLEAPRTHSSL